MKYNIYRQISIITICSVFFLSLQMLFVTDSQAAFLKLKKKMTPSYVKFVVFQRRKPIVDNDYKIQDPPDSEAHYGIRSSGKLREMWTCASSWRDKATANIRAIDYRDFRLDTDLPEGARIKCYFDVLFDYYGYANNATFGSGRASYLMQLNAGLLKPPRLKAWDHPALGRTAFVKTNNKIWLGSVVDLARDVIQDEAKDLIMDPIQDVALEAAAGVGGMAGGALSVAVIFATLVIDAVIELGEHNEDANKADYIISAQDDFASYDGVWLTVGEMYRTFISFELRSHVAMPGQSLAENFSYICFYNHPPYKGKDFRGALSKIGFGITNVELAGYDPDNVRMPSNYVYPIIDIAEFKPQTDPKHFRPNRSERFEVNFVNRGKKNLDNCKVHVKTPNPNKSFDIQLPSISAGGNYVYYLDYAFDDYGEHIFTLTIDPEKKLDEYMDLTHTKEYKFRFYPRCDLAVDDTLKIARKDGFGRVQTEKMAVLTGSISNTGDKDVKNTIVRFEVNGAYMRTKKLELGELKSGGEASFSVDFKPKKDYLIIQARVSSDPSQPETDTSNNMRKIEMEIEPSEVIWRVSEEDYKISPEEPEEGDLVTFKVAVMNDGNALGEHVRGKIYIDDPFGVDDVIKKFEFHNIGPKEKRYIEGLTWTAKKPRSRPYSFNLVFRSDKTKVTKKEKIPFKAPFWVSMKGIGLSEGIDVGVTDARIESDEGHPFPRERFYYKTYNKGKVWTKYQVEKYLVYGDGSTAMIGYPEKFKMSAQMMREDWFYYPTGNYKYKIVTFPLSEDGKRADNLDTDFTNNELYYTCEEFIDEAIHNLEITAVIARVQKIPGGPLPPNVKESYYYRDENSNEYYVHFSVIVANTGNVPCPITDIECLIIDAKRANRIPEFSGEYYREGPDGFHHVWEYPKPRSRKDIGNGAVRTRRPLRSSTGGIIPTLDRLDAEWIHPTSTTHLLANVYILDAYSLLIPIFRKGGEYIFKATIDPEGRILDDFPEDNTVIMKFSIPELLHKLEHDKPYFFIVKRGTPGKAKKALIKYNDIVRGEDYPMGKFIILPALRSYGFINE